VFDSQREMADPPKTRPVASHNFWEENFLDGQGTNFWAAAYVTMQIEK